MSKRNLSTKDGKDPDSKDNKPTIPGFSAFLFTQVPGYDMDDSNLMINREKVENLPWARFLAKVQVHMKAKCQQQFVLKIVELER